MKIVDVQVIPFRVPGRPFENGKLQPETEMTQTLTKVITDEGAEGYYFGGHGIGFQDGMSNDQQDSMRHRIKSIVVGHDPFDRERFWDWLWAANIEENLISVIDMALWDLQARTFGVPVYKLLGGCRDRVKAYASSYPNIGTPEVYADHAAACQAQGYEHYKIHPYLFWDPETQQAAPGRPAHIDADIEICRAVRARVGDDMVLSLDPVGTYRTYEEALRVGRELEKLDFYWYEHPMPEYRVSSYVKLCQELSVPILSPETAAGSLYTRAEWILRGASDINRIDPLQGGITGVRKMLGLCEAFGVRCELHVGGSATIQLLGATSEDVCEYYERGLLAPGVDYDTPPPYLETICDPLDKDGYVRVPQEPGLGYQVIWDYIEENQITTQE